MATEYSLRDKHGRHYLLLITEDSGQMILLKLFTRSWLGQNLCVGQVNLAWQEADRLLLGDIHIELSYRQQGIGTAVLKRIIILAQKRGAAVLEGEVTQGDLGVTPKLLAWYERHGFSVQHLAVTDHSSQQRECRNAQSVWLAQARASKGISSIKTVRVARIWLALSADTEAQWES